MSHTGRLFFCKIIIDFSSLGYQLRWPRSLWAFFSSSKNLTPTDPARFYPHKSHGSGAARDSSISSSCLLAEHLSLYRSRPFTLLRSTRELSSGHTAGFVDICGYTLCARSLLRSADSKTANTRLGATKPQTKANTIAAGVSRAYVVSMSDHAKETSREKREKKIARIFIHHLRNRLANSRKLTLLICSNYFDDFFS